MKESSNQLTARIAGLLYLVVILAGMFSLAYVPKQLFVWDNPTQTFHNIIAQENLFRWSILSSAICYIAFTFLPIALYQLFKPVDGFYAKIMVLLAIISIPISFSNLQNKYAILSLVETAQKTSTPAIELQQQVMQYLIHYDNGILVCMIFWGCGYSLLATWSINHNFCLNFWVSYSC